MVIVQIRLDDVDDRWSSSVMIGVVCLRSARAVLPSSALDIQSPCWIICDDAVYKNGTKVCYTSRWCNFSLKLLLLVLSAFILLA